MPDQLDAETGRADWWELQREHEAEQMQSTEGEGVMEQDDGNKDRKQLGNEEKHQSKRKEKEQ